MDPPRRMMPDGQVFGKEMGRRAQSLFITEADGERLRVRFFLIFYRELISKVK